MNRDSAKDAAGLARHPLWTWLLRVTVGWGVVTILGPLLVVAAVSFATRETYGWIRWTPTAANYHDLWHPLYGWVFLQSLWLAGITTVGCLVLGFPVAYLMARASPRWQAVGLMLVLVPLWTNFLVRTYAWMVLLRSEGLINSWLMQLGLVDQPLAMLYTPTAVVLGLVYGYVPFMVLPIYAAMERVPRLLEDAARDLYASFWQTLLRVVMPLVWPGIAAGSLLVFLASVGAYLTPDLLGGARTMMIGNLIQHEFLAARDWPLGSALSMALIVLTLGIVIVWRRLWRPALVEPHA